MANVIFDSILPVYRDKYFWIPVYIFIIFFSLFNYPRKAYWFIVYLVVTVGLSDALSAHFVKKTVQRPRPCHEVETLEVRQLVKCGRGYSFTSNHAANHFAISFFLLWTAGLRFRKLKWPLLFWAFSIAFAQVYVGVHYPLDVIFGALLGIGISFLMVRLYRYSEKAIPDFVPVRSVKSLK